VTHIDESKDATAQTLNDHPHTPTHRLKLQKLKLIPMTQSRSHLTEQEFHAAQKKRLSMLHLDHPLSGSWSELLIRQLKRRLTEHLDPVCDHRAVIDCFANTPTEKIEQSIAAIGKACADVDRIDHDAAVWATELTVYAAVRLFNRDSLTVLPHWRGSGHNEHAAVLSIPTSSSLMASICLAALRGTYIRLGPQKQSRGSFETGSLATPTIWSSTNATDSILGRLYDEMMRGKAPATRNPNAPLTQDQKGALRAEFDEFRLDDELATIFIETLPLNDQDCEETAKVLAETVNSYVVRGAGQHGDLLVQGAQGIDVSSLKAKIEKVFGMLPIFGGEARNADAASKPSTGSPAANQSVAAPAQIQQYEYDVFVSHASEDKATLTDVLVTELRAVGLQVWYDKFVITAGDSLPAKINDGLRKSRFGAVVFSPHFLEKGWPNGELDSFISSEMSKRVKRVIPILFNMSFEVFSADYPLVASKLAIYANKGIPHVVDEIKRAVDVAKRPS
jgi:hypothetical protein